MGDMQSCLVTAATACLPSLLLLTSTGTPDWSSMPDEVFFLGEVRLSLACGLLSGHTSPTTIV